MIYAKEQIIEALCNEYKALFTQEAFDPASDLNCVDYRNAMLIKTLPELIKETLTDLEYYSRCIHGKVWLMVKDLFAILWLKLRSHAWN
jgi:hypothetical protein